jgi:Tfp pilus assembly protein PilF
MYSKAYSAENENIASAEENLGDVLCEEGKYSQSEPLLRHALEFFKEQPGIKNPNTQDAATYLAILLDKTHRGAEAAALRREFAINPTSQTAATESSTMPSQSHYP